MGENWERDLLKGVIRTSLMTWLLPNEMLSSWEMRGQESYEGRLLLKSLLFSLVVAHVCQCSYLEVKGSQATCLVFLLQPLQHLIMGLEKVICCWMNGPGLGTFINPFINFHNYLLSMVHPALVWFIGTGGGVEEKWDSVCWTFCWPWEFSTLHEDYFLRFQLCWDIWIFVDENMKGWT